MVNLLPEAAISTNRSPFFSLDNPEMPLENDAYPLDGAGVLDTALDFCRRKDWIDVRILREAVGQIATDGQALGQQRRAVKLEAL